MIRLSGSFEFMRKRREGLGEIRRILVKGYGVLVINIEVLVMDREILEQMFGKGR